MRPRTRPRPWPGPGKSFHTWAMPRSSESCLFNSLRRLCGYCAWTQPSNGHSGNPSPHSISYPFLSLRCTEMRTDKRGVRPWGERRRHHREPLHWRARSPMGGRAAVEWFPDGALRRAQTAVTWPGGPGCSSASDCDGSRAFQWCLFFYSVQRQQWHLPRTWWEAGRTSSIDKQSLTTVGRSTPTMAQPHFPMAAVILNHLLPARRCRSAVNGGRQAASERSYLLFPVPNIHDEGGSGMPMMH
jgi:hypothetical protein